jgi:ABC-type molybdate transport system substrate-binding protein
MIAAVASACGGSTGGSGSTGAAPAGPPPAMQASPLTGPLTVLATDPLSAAFQDAKGKLASTNPGLSLTIQFGAGPALVEQLRQGEVDVIAADAATMRSAVGSGLIEAPTVIARKAEGGATVIYSAAAVTKSRNQAAAQAFVGYLATGRGQRILQTHGFTAP